MKVKCNKCSKEHEEEIEGTYDIGFCPFCIKMTNHSLINEEMNIDKCANLLFKTARNNGFKILGRLSLENLNLKEEKKTGDK